MKRIIFVLFCLIVCICFLNPSKQITIPKESIRYRIIANSNNAEDQKLKWNINNKLLPSLTNTVESSSNIVEARTNINNNIDMFKKIIESETDDYKINYGQNFFPEKKYDDVIYKEGNYESLVITLGSGEGQNFWCVMFPPLCLLEAEKNDTENINYNFYVKKIINKYL